MAFKRFFGLALAIVIIASSMFVAIPSVRAAGENVFVSGTISEAGTGAPIANATIFVLSLWSGDSNSTATNASGYYNLSLSTQAGKWSCPTRSS